MTLANLWSLRAINTYLQENSLPPQLCYCMTLMVNGDMSGWAFI